MGYWQEVKDVLLKGAHLAAEGIKEGTETIVSKTKEGAHIASEGIKEGAETVMDKTKEGATIAASGIKDSAGTFIDKTKDNVQLAKLKAKLHFKHKEFQSIMADLGDATHDIYKVKEDLYANEKIKELMDHAVNIEEECKTIENEILVIKKQTI